MSDKRANLFTRDDTFFGVCEGLGEELGIPSNLLRLAFVPVLLLEPALAFEAYAALGLLVLAIRWLVPARPARSRAPLPALTPAPAAGAEVETLPLAA